MLLDDVFELIMLLFEFEFGEVATADPLEFEFGEVATADPLEFVTLELAGIEPEF
jgi:hypothetical protein